MDELAKHPLAVIVTMFVAILSLIGTMYTVTNQSTTNQARMCLDESTALRDDNERLLRENVRLITDLAKEINTLEVLEATLDGLKHPIWINRVIVLDSPNERGELIEFRMYRINMAYQKAFKISNAEYEGKTAFDVWPEATAKIFHANDMDALRMGTIRTSETFPSEATNPNSALITMKIDKELIMLPDGSQALICLAYRFM